MRINLDAAFLMLSLAFLLLIFALCKIVKKTNEGAIYPIIALTFVFLFGVLPLICYYIC